MNPRILRLLSLVGLVTLVTLAATGLSTAAGYRASSGTTAIWHDDFNSATLNARWSWLREDPTHWSLTERAGFLRITTQKGGFFSGHNAKNVLLQDAPTGDFDVRTRVLFTPTDNIQSAGLIVYQDDDNYLAVLRAFCGFDPPCAGNAIYFDHADQGGLVGDNHATMLTPPGDAYLRLVRRDTTYTAYASSDGMLWTMLGTHTVSASFNAAKVGLFAHDADFGAPEINADFDFFSLDAMPHKVLLPLIAKQVTQPALAYQLVPNSGTCVPNAGVSYYGGTVRDRAGNLQNGVCVHVAFYGPRTTKCSGCDGVGDGNWGFAPFGGPAPANIPVEIYIVPCPESIPVGGQTSDFGDLTPQSDKWLFTTSSTSMQCTGITFRQN